MAAADPRAMPAAFAILSERSIFTKGRTSAGRWNTPPEPSTTPTTSSSSPRPEDSLVFNGATDADGMMAAFVEDTAAGKVSKLRVGDAVAQGRVKGITLDALDYEAGGKVVRVAIGQTLAGEQAPTTRASLGDATTTPSGAPSAGGGDDVLQRMRLRRLQELGGR